MDHVSTTLIIKLTTQCI